MTGREALVRLLLLSGSAACATLGWAGVEAVASLRDLREQTGRVAARIDGMAASAEVYQAQLIHQLNDPRTQRGIGLLLRSGDDMARVVKRSAVVLERLDGAVLDLRVGVMAATDSARAATDAAAAAVPRLEGMALDLGAQSSATMLRTERRVGDAVDSLDAAIAGSRRLIAHTDETVLQIQPHLVAATQSVAVSAAATQEVAVRAEKSTRWISYMGRGFAAIGRAVSFPFR